MGFSPWTSGRTRDPHLLWVVSRLMIRRTFLTAAFVGPTGEPWSRVAVRETRCPIRSSRYRPRTDLVPCHDLPGRCRRHIRCSAGRLGRRKASLRRSRSHRRHGSSGPCVPSIATGRHLHPDRAAPEDTENNHYFELYRDDRLLDSGLLCSSQAGSSASRAAGAGSKSKDTTSRSTSRCVIWTGRGGAAPAIYAGFTGSGKAEFLYPEPELYGILGRLSGNIRNAPMPSLTPSTGSPTTPNAR